MNGRAARIGPEMDSAATTSPVPSRTGADTDATPASRCPTDWAQPRRRTSTKLRSVNLACDSTDERTGSSMSQAHRTWAPEPAVSGSRLPIGTVVRSP